MVLLAPDCGSACGLIRAHRAKGGGCIIYVILQLLGSDL